MSVKHCRSLLWDRNDKRKTVILQWIPYHCGIPENEVANKLAKKCTVHQTVSEEVYYRSTTSKIHLVTRDLHASELKEIIKGKSQTESILILLEKRRYRAVAAFRMMTNRCLYAPLYDAQLLSKDNNRAS